MTAAYVDSSFLLAIVFGEARTAGLPRTLGDFDEVFSSDLLVAECISAAMREQLEPQALSTALEWVEIVLPSRSLLHIARALFLADETRRDLAFLSRDTAQRNVAAALGFPTP
jgi:uncharacterized protein with PIN domain